MDRFVRFSERVSHNPIVFPPDESAGPAVILTEQLAKTLHVSAGDRIDIGIKDMAKKEVRVAGVTENYISNYIYITPASYETLFGSVPEYTSILLKTDMPEDRLDSLLARAGEDGNVTGTSSIAPAREVVDMIVENLAGVVNLIILVAAMLAFVVLYNLTNINITERERELATLKVLGFYPREVAAYISRETMILTVIGAGAGLVGGIFFHDYVMSSVELDNFMFPRLIMPQSYAYAAVFTIICSFIIGLCMRPRLNRIDPVGSLKSVE
jgi:putative ABC transport system permease protein